MSSIARMIFFFIHPVSAIFEIWSYVAIYIRLSLKNKFTCQRFEGIQYEVPIYTIKRVGLLSINLLSFQWLSIIVYILKYGEKTFQNLSGSVQHLINKGHSSTPNVSWTYHGKEINIGIWYQMLFSSETYNRHTKVSRL